MSWARATVVTIIANICGILLNVSCKQTHSIPQQPTEARVRGANVYIQIFTNLNQLGNMTLWRHGTVGFIVKILKFEPGLFCIRAADLKGANFSRPVFSTVK